MSIIHDALKKIQQGFPAKAENIQPSPSTKPPVSSEPLFSMPQATETLTQTVEKIAQEKPPIKNKLKSLYIATCTILISFAIVVASILFIYRQYKNNIPDVQGLAQKSFYTLTHKNLPSSFQAKAPERLKPLAQLTINPSTTNTSNFAKTTPITLNIHGIMANTSGNLVLINDQVYQEGDTVDGAKIIKINLDSISVIVNGAEQTISVEN